MYFDKWGHAVHGIEPQSAPTKPSLALKATQTRHKLSRRLGRFTAGITPTRPARKSNGRQLIMQALRNEHARKKANIATTRANNWDIFCTQLGLVAELPTLTSRQLDSKVPYQENLESCLTGGLPIRPGKKINDYTRFEGFAKMMDDKLGLGPLHEESQE